MSGILDEDENTAPDEIEVNNIVYYKHVNRASKFEAQIEASMTRDLGYFARVRKFGDRWFVYRAKRQ